MVAIIRLKIDIKYYTEYSYKITMLRVTFMINPARW